MWSCRFITCFVTVFAIVIAITKDLADVEGDRRYNIKTLATTLGVRNIAFLGEQDSLAGQLLARHKHDAASLSHIFHLQALDYSA